MVCFKENGCMIDFYDLRKCFFFINKYILVSWILMFGKLIYIEYNG